VEFRGDGRKRLGREFRGERISGEVQRRGRLRRGRVLLISGV
jgi:hypothetical protein